MPSGVHHLFSSRSSSRLITISPLGVFCGCPSLQPATLIVCLFLRSAHSVPFRASVFVSQKKPGRASDIMYFTQSLRSGVIAALLLGNLASAHVLSPDYVKRSVSEKALVKHQAEPDPTVAPEVTLGGAPPAAPDAPDAPDVTDAPDAAPAPDAPPAPEEPPAAPSVLPFPDNSTAPEAPPAAAPAAPEAPPAAPAAPEASAA
ncbi:hypothetical protein QBC47DRAFT_367009 [Echria macrotheca]|uniref:Uncharacterized protein n=1 Tax=Echria macrotheca TaxID=438768 RepID=A0AAJ0FEI1_9PEZI|nr:hypothetical protein QBC47DRAFT_367009 [Echria macrotheca]